MKKEESIIISKEKIIDKREKLENIIGKDVFLMKKTLQDLIKEWGYEKLNEAPRLFIHLFFLEREEQEVYKFIVSSFEDKYERMSKDMKTYFQRNLFLLHLYGLHLYYDFSGEILSKNILDKKGIMKIFNEYKDSYDEKEKVMRQLLEAEDIPGNKIIESIEGITLPFKTSRFSVEKREDLLKRAYPIEFVIANILYGNKEDYLPILKEFLSKK